MQELEKHQNNKQLVKATAEQITKDFGMIGQEIYFDLEAINIYEELVSEVLPIVRDLLINHTAQLYNLLYRIDISEDMIKAKMKKDAGFNADEVLADLIIKREFQKVILRQIHNKNINN